MDFAQYLSPATAFLLFAIATGVIVFAGCRMAKLADQLADRTQLGEALAGVLLLGAATSLPGMVTSIAAAAEGRPTMAVNNALGGIAVQTAFLVVADFFWKKANLEHAAASLANIFQGLVLVTLLSLVLSAGFHPMFSGWPVHPVSVLLFVCFAFGQKVISRMKDEPMWRPVITRDTRCDEPEQENENVSLRLLLAKFIGLAVMTGFAGYLLAVSGFTLIDKAGFQESVVGALFTAVASSLPELITSVAAVRQGAYTLAVSGIIGGNAFDTLFVAASDVAYTEGSIYHSIAQPDIFLAGLTILMTAVLTGGLLVREKRGPANVGWEGIIILAIYAAVVVSRFHIG